MEEIASSTRKSSPFEGRATGWLPAGGRLPRWSVAVAGVVLCFILGYIDYRTGYEVSFSIFYFLPIIFVTWYGGMSLGILISALSAVLWFMCDIYSGHRYSHEFIPYWNSFMRLCIFAIVTYLLSSMRNYAERERNASRVDSLTGIGNSKNFYEAASAELERQRRYGSVFSIVYIDVDNFKSINDTMGHNEGDKVLRLAASTVRKGLRAIDVVARMGGDEFAALLPETESEQALAVIKRIKTKLTEAMGANKYPVTFSIGVATIRTPHDTVDKIIGRADSLMYEVKNSGKDDIRAKIF